MKKSRNRPIEHAELLAPAGSFEKLEVAVHYGADAVYLAGKNFSLRNFSDNFTLAEIRSAIDLCHKAGVRVYVACNIYPRNFELQAIADFLAEIGKLSPDGIIVADAGIAATALRLIPHVPLHISTQANITSLSAARFWEEVGACRINLARELSLQEIKTIADESEIATEIFVHGAMCMSYSGRCLLSSFMAGRGSNRGMCSHPCRWQYAVVEELRPGKYMPLSEDDRGTYIFHSRDLCMIDHIPDLIESGVRALKIEGRMKSVHYLASTVKVYREAIDRYYSGPESYRFDDAWREEVRTTATRGYCTGFYYGNPGDAADDTVDPMTHRPIRFLGKVLRSIASQTALIEVRNRIRRDCEIEILSPAGPIRKDRVLALKNANGLPLSIANPGTIVEMETTSSLREMDIIRRVEKTEESQS